jgi:hypothetical protein
MRLIILIALVLCLGPAAARAQITPPASNPFNVANYGASGSGASTVCSTKAGSTAMTLGVGHDFKAGYGIRCLGAGPISMAAPVANLAAVQNGTTGSTSIEYALATTDDHGGLSAAQMVTVSNANATQDYRNNVQISGTPSSTTAAIVVWKNVADAGWNYIGAWEPVWTATIVAGGSGYTPGWWSFRTEGGGCGTPLVGQLLINSNGELEQVKVASWWSRCTSPPTLIMPAKAGVGSGAAATFGAGIRIFDTGIQGRLIKPDWVQPSPPGAATHQWFVAKIDSLTRNAAHLDSAAASTTNNVAAYHDDTTALQAAIDAAGSAGREVYFSRGDYLISSSLHVTRNFVGLIGEGNGRSVNLLSYGNFDDIVWKGAGQLVGNAEQNILHVSYHKVGGWGDYVSNVSHFTMFNVGYDHAPGGLYIDRNNDVRLDHLRGYTLWGPGYSDYLFVGGGGASGIGCCIQMNDVYANDAAQWDTNQGGDTRRGMAFDGQATILGQMNAVSNVEGYGLWFGDSATGVGTQFVQMQNGGSEFSVLASLYLRDCTFCYFTDYNLHGAGNGASNLWVGVNSKHVGMKGGFLTGASAAGAELYGVGGMITGVSIAGNSAANRQGTFGERCGVDIGGYNNSISGNTIGDPDTASWQACPVAIGRSAEYTSVVGNSFGGNVSPSVQNYSSSPTNVVWGNAPP